MSIMMNPGVPPSEWRRQQSMVKVRASTLSARYPDAAAVLREEGAAAEREKLVRGASATSKSDSEATLLSLNAATAERERILAIFGLDCHDARLILEFVNDPSCTPERAALLILKRGQEHRADAMRRIVGDERAIAPNAPRPLASSTMEPGSAAETSSRILALHHAVEKTRATK